MSAKVIGSTATTLTLIANLCETIYQKYRREITPAKSLLSHALAESLVATGHFLSIPIMMSLTSLSFTSTWMTKTIFKGHISLVDRITKKHSIELSLVRKQNVYFDAAEMRAHGVDLSSKEWQAFIRRAEMKLSFKSIAAAFSSQIENEQICSARTFNRMNTVIPKKIDTSVSNQKEEKADHIQEISL